VSDPNLDKLRAQGIAMLDQHWLTLAEHQREIMRIAMYGPEQDEDATHPTTHSTAASKAKRRCARPLHPAIIESASIARSIVVTAGG